MDATRPTHRRTAVRALVIALVASFVVPTQPVVAEGVVGIVSASVDEARTPSISADGRWVVFEGSDGGRRSVFRTDRASGRTVELAEIPSGVRAGDTILPRLSSDGCVVVAVTEVAFDLFRDDDRDERWDVYRLVVPECGGQRNAWELVSVSEQRGIARDGVFTTAAPAISGSGAVIAYVHQRPGAPEGVGTISVVDLTVPVGQPGRSETVAGMPGEAPNRAFLYEGASEPALSDDGHQLGFVADFTASEALPGWGSGPVAGGPATRHVYVWDRRAPDQRRAVRLISGRDGVPSAAGGHSPVLSEDGRVVAFVSADRALVTAEIPRCTPDCPTQVFRYDRDTDGNGILDEPPRRDPLTMVSAIGAGVVDVGVPVAGDRSSWAPAMTLDGSQIAFVTDATNLLPDRRAGGGDVTDGDLLVAEIHLGQLRRAVDGLAQMAVPGAHGAPSISRTGQVLAFETVTGEMITGTERPTWSGRRMIATVQVRPRLSLAALDFGTTLLGWESAEMYATVLNAGPAAFAPTNVSVSSNFRITGGTCAKGILVAAGTSCSVNLTFRPTAPRGYSGTLTVTGSGEGAVSVSAALRGAAGEPALVIDPGGIDFPPAIVGSPGGRIAVDVTNVGFLPTSVDAIWLEGANPDDFTVTEQSCRNRAVNPDATCAIEVEFRPSGAGYRSALLLVRTPIGQYTSAVLGGLATYAPVAGFLPDQITVVSPDGSGDSAPAEPISLHASREAAGHEPTVAPGGVIAVGGRGYPIGSAVVIGFDDGSPPLALARVDERGEFTITLRLPTRLRFGEHRLVASGPEGAVAALRLDVAARSATRVAGLPGFGMG